jgi:hypothetical protein
VPRVGLAVGEAAKKVFDAVAKQSQEFEKGLGKGGVFSGEHGGARAMNRRLKQWHHDRNQMAGRTLGADGQLVEMKDEVRGT